MSVTQPRTAAREPSAQKVTPQTLLDRKRSHQPITALTAYDYPSARLVDEAGIDLILVGDSLAMVALGYDSTLPITVDEMLHHARAVRRAVRHALLVVDMPFGSYHTTPEAAVANAIRFVKEAGAEAVKIEGGATRASLIEQLTRAEIPVVGHIGLTPQSLNRMGGYKVQGRSIPAIESLLADAAAIEGAGAIALVLEGIPREVAARITAAAGIPVIGIGAGPDCDGQILVFHDLFNLTFSPGAKFVRRFADAGALMREGLQHFQSAVQDHSFPNDAESYHLPIEVAEHLAETITR
ncbi:3-methyl-2-oxobutanoate hydroxymethyltransferase [Granulicella tundricola]|uniref:3-methyl-2-oxobutanoate hydroxymethyltransferase n=1 Tax=Granulicella tundricola (strain ATCC BAA-1859 / DSM 23138 / MP5ACTX9) TaxID=1198114 RepID=E8WV64_GRATM|nr:3-methyl-2-oxobutanoate hydroxymethyltransferase [Granulicella tundricola]ADW67239.1 3-methyl-2-oxobutanoate hydroxymethyltransferase [Granulicella tundricola MP5ACTX9]